MKVQFIFAGSLCATALLSGCGKSSSEPISNAAEHTSPVVQGQKFEGDGYSLTMPKDWKVMDFSKGDWKKVVEAIKTDPHFSGMSGMMEQLANQKMIKLFAVDPNGATNGFAANLNVIDVPVPAGTTPERIFKENHDQMSKMGEGKFTDEPIKIGSVEAHRMKWTLTSAGSKNTLVTIIAAPKDRQVIFTFTSPESKDSVTKPEFDQVIDSIKFQ